LFAGEDIRKKIVQSKVELKNTGLGQNKKKLGGEVKFYGVKKTRHSLVN
jgi:hypothetical protein